MGGDFDLVLRGAIVSHAQTVDDGWVACRGGKVALVGVGAPPSGARFEDLRGLYILPGCIDGQTHTGSQAGQEGLGMASRAAAAGGVTAYVDMPYDDPEPVTTGALLRAKAEIVEREAHVDVALYATITASEAGLDEIDGLIGEGAAAFKFSTFEASPTRFPQINDELLFQAFSKIAPSGLACGVHNQDQEMTRRNIARLVEAGDTGWDAFGRAHPNRVEDLATAKVFEIGAQTGARAHVVHVSSPRGFEIARMYRAAGHHAIVETCVQYLMLNEEEHMSRLGARTKHFPPIRPKAQMEALWRYVAAGECVFVSSDHVAWGLERKGNPNIFLNAAGGPGLETLLPAFWTGCEERGLPFSLVARLLAKGPAEHFGLAGKGALEPGYDADITVIEPGAYAYDPSHSFSAVNWSAYDGRRFTAKVVATFLRGAPVFADGAIQNQPGSGRFLRPSVSASPTLERA
jgi:allantoinase